MLESSSWLFTAPILRTYTYIYTFLLRLLTHRDAIINEVLFGNGGCVVYILRRQFRLLFFDDALPYYTPQTTDGLTESFFLLLQSYRGRKPSGPVSLSNSSVPENSAPSSRPSPQPVHMLKPEQPVQQQPMVSTKCFVLVILVSSFLTYGLYFSWNIIIAL